MHTQATITHNETQRQTPTQTPESANAQRNKKNNNDYNNVYFDSDTRFIVILISEYDHDYRIPIYFYELSNILQIIQQ